MGSRTAAVALALAPLLLCAQAPDTSDARRHQDLDVLLRLLSPSLTPRTGRMNAFDKTWEEWVQRTGELPPDFAAMPSIPELPDPLDRVANEAQWLEKRKWIRAQFEQWVFGHMPPAPDNLRAVVTGTHIEGGVTVRDVRLEFGPGHRATLRVQLLIPPGKGPFPVFMTDHPRTYPWVVTAVRRGYIGCIYYATDPKYGEADDSDAYIDVYPEYDFSCLARWAWAGMRAVDYLVGLPEVDRNKIAVTGHSRNGKQALLAAAFDERIAAVIPSSGNTGECDPWRYTTDMYANETLEEISGAAPHWTHPRLRFFVGREHKLPVDQNMLLALVAPRALLMYSAFAETEGNPFGFEQAYRSVKRVYTLLGHPEMANLYLRVGEHPMTAGDIELMVDYLDGVFGRREPLRFETWINGYTFERWKEIAKETRNAPSPSAPLASRIHWALGQEPAGVRFPASSKLKSVNITHQGWLEVLFNRPVTRPGMAHAPVAFGDDLAADLYYPQGAKGKMPVVIWLHPFSYPTGYSRYAQMQLAPFIDRGFAVLAFDQLGFGTRVEHAGRFYERYPHWSLLGKMVTDTRAAVDAVAQLDVIDASRIYLAGYALGGKVAVWTAALEPRVKAVVSIAGFTPLRISAGKGIEGIQQYSHLHGLVPRFGYFLGQERQLPLDYDELLAAIAPRPVFVVAPTLDRYSPVEDVRQAVRAAGAHVEIETPLDFNRLSPATLKRVAGWLAAR
jgi:dienelactone hydrolase